MQLHDCLDVGKVRPMGEVRAETPLEEGEEREEFERLLIQEHQAGELRCSHYCTYT